MATVQIRHRATISEAIALISSSSVIDSRHSTISRSRTGRGSQEASLCVRTTEISETTVVNRRCCRFERAKRVDSRQVRQPVPQVTASEAIASGASVPADVVAAQLLEIRAPITKGKSTLVWAIQEALPGGSGFVSSASLSVGGKIEVARATYNFRVDFVNARSGRLTFPTEGHRPASRLGTDDRSC